MPLENHLPYKGYYSEQDCSAAAFLSLISEPTSISDLRFAASTEHNIPMYDARDVEKILRSLSRQDLLAEWTHVLNERSGIVVLKQAMVDLDAVDEATEFFNKIIQEERITNTGGDHFGERGANYRIWNSLQKLCLRNPSLFARYFSSPSIAAISEAWLGPWSQMTAQVNLVRPGGKPQTCHRDYHLGFMPQEQAKRFPSQAHLFSAALTLQGAIAHCDMPIESGPTKLLPNSQRFAPGYIAVQMPNFREIFEEKFVQIALEKGDVLFFSPALYHAAGENRSTDIDRMANLLQVSSAMGRSLERIDRRAMVSALFPVLKNLNLPQEHLVSVIAASAEGYPFPTNLDTDPPVGGLASESQAELLARGLTEDLSIEEFEKALFKNSARRKP